MALIRIDLQRITQKSDPQLSRQQQVQQHKEMTAEMRNRYLSAQLQQSVQNADFARTAYGKPYLPEYPQFYFNHSHSQEHYALAASHQVADLGVDIEDLNRTVRFEALAQHAFHPAELQTWRMLEQEKEYWFKVWTIKEAVLKASGLGIRISLHELNTQAHAGQSGGLCSHPAIGVFAYQTYILPHAALSIAWRSEQSCRGFQFPQIEICSH